MRKILCSLTCASVILTFSCTKNRDHLAKNITIDTTLASGAQYTLDLQPYGDADDIAIIKQQATNFITSEITNTGNSISSVYHFSTEADSKTPVSEQVILAITEGSRNGRRHYCDSSFVTINFKVQ